MGGQMGRHKVVLLKCSIRCNAGRTLFIFPRFPVHDRAFSTVHLLSGLFTACAADRGSSFNATLGLSNAVVDMVLIADSKASLH